MSAVATSSGAVTCTDCPSGPVHPKDTEEQEPSPAQGDRQVDMTWGEEENDQPAIVSVDVDVAAVERHVLGGAWREIEADLHGCSRIGDAGVVAGDR